LRASTWIAVGLFAVAAAWFASSLVIGGRDESEETASAEPPQPTEVEVQDSAAEKVPQHIFAQGVAQPYRTTDVIAAAGGTLQEVLVQEGDRVEAGAVVARVRLEARENELRSAEARVASLEADLQGFRDLEDQGFATEARVRDLEWQLEQARAALQNVRDEIRDTTIEAPIPGVVSDLFVNSGEEAPAGTAIARIVDNAPLRVTLNISQRDVGKVDWGRVAVVSVATGDLAKGRLCFIAPAADPQTRTFRVEIRVPNEERKIPSVVSAEVRFQTGEVEAHFISSAILALSEAGELGVKSVDGDGVVRFHPVEIIRAVTDGVWVSGLPKELRLITTGQGFVRADERVRTREARGKQEGASGRDAGETRLPTATVEASGFEGAEDIPEPPPAETLCEGSAANSVTTSSVPAAAPSVGNDAGAATQQPPSAGAGGEAAGGEEGAPANSGTAGTPSQPGQAGATSRPGVAAPTAPHIAAPPVEQPPPQMPQGQGGAAGATPPPLAPDEGPGGSATPSGGQGGGGGQ
jgi:multidrug efflux system membrane fusion protein